MKFHIRAMDVCNYDLYYILRGDGHIFAFDFKKFKWNDVSSEVKLPDDGSWFFFRTDEKLFNSMVDSYEQKSLNYNKDDLHYFDQHHSFVWGKVLTYYKKNGQIRAKDENDNEYECTIPYILVSKDKMIDDTWKHIYRIDVIDEVAKYNEKVNIADMKLYLDKYRDLRAFSDDGTEYRVSYLTGYVSLVSDSKGVLPSYVRVNESVFKMFSGVESSKYSLNQISIARMRELDNYLFKAKSELIEKYNITLGDDIWFYKNGFGNIFAEDNYDNEFNVLPEQLVPVKQGTIDCIYREQIENLDALDLAKFYKKRKEELKKKDCEILPLDLHFIEETVSTATCIDEKGNTYILKSDGKFHSYSKVKPALCGIDKTSLYYNQSKDHLVRKILSNRSICFLRSYIKKYLPSFFDRHDKDLDMLRFYKKRNKNGDIDIYMIDLDYDNEYRCKRDSIEKVPNNTITINFTYLPSYQFSAYFHLAFD